MERRQGDRRGDEQRGDEDVRQVLLRGEDARDGAPRAALGQGREELDADGDRELRPGQVGHRGEDVGDDAVGDIAVQKL